MQCRTAYFSQSGRLQYAETLIGFKAGAISAVSPDPRVRLQECELAVSAIGKVVIVDTSVAVLHAELTSDLTDIGGAIS